MKMKVACVTETIYNSIPPNGIIYAKVKGGFSKFRFVHRFILGEYFFIVWQPEWINLTGDDFYV